MTDRQAASRTGVHRTRRKPPGITPAQAGYLRDLERALGRDYTGDGMTVRQAAKAISRALREIEQLGPR